MNKQTLAFLNLVALALLYLGFIPASREIASLLILIVAVILFMKR